MFFSRYLFLLYEFDSKFAQVDYSSQFSLPTAFSTQADYCKKENLTLLTVKCLYYQNGVWEQIICHAVSEQKDPFSDYFTVEKIILDYLDDIRVSYTMRIKVSDNCYRSGLDNF